MTVNALKEQDASILLRDVHKRVAAFHKGAPRNSNVLHLVYFHPHDREPLPYWRVRLERVVNDVRAFYVEEMRHYGLRIDGFPLARRRGALIFHLVRGTKPASAYRYQSGRETKREIQRSLRRSLALKNDHLLVFYGLCRRNTDGSFVFDAPYYANGDSRCGIAHVADCDLLDPLMLTNTQQRIVYTEHYYARRDQSVAEFNSAYLGGVAHELGHCLGLPHDAGTPVERKRRGTSLMGTGNLTYRAEQWSEIGAAYLSAASILRLLSHPLLTRSNRERATPVRAELKLQVWMNANTLWLKGTVSGRIAAYAVIATISPCGELPENSPPDHQSYTYPALVQNEAFAIGIPEFRCRSQKVRLSTLHLNGSTQDFELIPPASMGCKSSASSSKYERGEPCAFTRSSSC